MGKIKEEFENLYNNIFKKHMKKSCIIVLIFIIAIVYMQVNKFIATPQFMENLKKFTFIMPTILSQSINDIVFLIVLVLLGTVPYMYASYLATPFIALQYSFRILILDPTSAETNILTLILSAIFRIVAVAIAISYSGLLCKKTTKKFKLTSAKSYNFQDMKKDVYNLSKKKEKVKEIEKAKQEKIDKLEKEVNEIETNYKTSIIIVVITSLLLIVSTVLEKLI